MPGASMRRLVWIRWTMDVPPMNSSLPGSMVPAPSMAMCASMPPCATSTLPCRPRCAFACVDIDPTASPTRTTPPPSLSNDLPPPPPPPRPPGGGRLASRPRRAQRGEQVGVELLLERVVIPLAAGIQARGRPCAREPEVDEVLRLADAMGPGIDLRLVARQPGRLGHQPL